jgi:hypothetical protein
MQRRPADQISSPFSRLYDGLLRSPDLRAVPELIALLVNLCTLPGTAEVRGPLTGGGRGSRPWVHEHSCPWFQSSPYLRACVCLPNQPLPPQWFCVGERLDRLARRALQGAGDELALKLLRNLAAVGGPPLAAKMACHVPGMVGMLQVRGLLPVCLSSDSRNRTSWRPVMARASAKLFPSLQDQAATPNLQAEVLGTLAAVFDAVPLSPADSEQTAGPDDSEQQQAAAAPNSPSWNSLLIGCDIFGVLLSCLTGLSEDDALLEAVALTGALAGHAQLAPQLAESGAVSGLARLGGLQLDRMGEASCALVQPADPPASSPHHTLPRSCQSWPT